MLQTAQARLLLSVSVMCTHKWRLLIIWFFICVQGLATEVAKTAFVVRSRLQALEAFNAAALKISVSSSPFSNLGLLVSRQANRSKPSICLAYTCDYRLCTEQYCPWVPRALVWM